MLARRIVRGQPVDQAKADRARELRRSPTPAEARLWPFLRRGALDGAHFRRQQVIDGFIVDCYCHRALLAVEVDGPIHQQRPGCDEERDAALARHGLRVLRVTNVEVEERLPEVLERIREALGAAAGGT